MFIDEEKFISECINLIVDENVKEILVLVGWMNPLTIMKLEILVVKIVSQKEGHELLFENCVDDYHEYGGPIGEWMNIDEFFDQLGLVTELCTKYKYKTHTHS